jgi:hypothetical protein
LFFWIAFFFICLVPRILIGDKVHGSTGRLHPSAT